MRRYEDQETTLDQDYLAQLVVAIETLTVELRCGQEPLILTEQEKTYSADGLEQIHERAVYVFPRGIVGIRRADNTTWIHSLSGRDYFVKELPEEIIARLIRFGQPVGR
jgi:uncharacterized protein YlzI (FlbEa/FlbD family)